jgi:hypothetical protein
MTTPSRAMTTGPRPRGCQDGAPAWPTTARAVATLLVALAAAGCTPTFDVSGTAVFRKSLAEISKQLDPAAQDTLRNAICYLAANGDYGSRHAAQVGGVGKSVKGTLFASTDVVATIVAELGFQEIGGRTAAQAIDAAQSQSMKYFHRAPPPVADQLAELKEALRRDTAAEIAAIEREIVPDLARLKSQYLLLASSIRAGPASFSAASGQGVLEFDIDNVGPMTIRAVRLNVAFEGHEPSDRTYRSFAPLRLAQDIAPGQTQHLRIALARDDATADPAPDPAKFSDVAVSISNALVSDGAWIVTVDVGKLEQKRREIAGLKAAESRARDNLDAMDELLR